MWIRAGGGGQPMWMIIKFYNIIIKSANVDKGGGVKRLSTRCGKKYVFLFLNPSLRGIIIFAITKTNTKEYDVR